MAAGLWRFLPCASCCAGGSSQGPCEGCIDEVSSWLWEVEVTGLGGECASLNDTYVLSLGAYEDCSYICPHFEVWAPAACNAEGICAGFYPYEDPFGDDYYWIFTFINGYNESGLLKFFLSTTAEDWPWNCTSFEVTLPGVEGAAGAQAVIRNA